MTLEREDDVLHRSVSVLGHDDVGLAVALGIGAVAVQQDHHVRILLDRSRFSEVGHLRPLVGALLRPTVELADRDDRDLELLREQLRARENSATSCWRDSTFLPEPSCR